MSQEARKTGGGGGGAAEGNSHELPSISRKFWLAPLAPGTSQDLLGNLFLTNCCRDNTTLSRQHNPRHKIMFHHDTDSKCTSTTQSKLRTLTELARDMVAQLVRVCVDS